MPFPPQRGCSRDRAASCGTGQSWAWLVVTQLDREGKTLFRVVGKLGREGKTGVRGGGWGVALAARRGSGSPVSFPGKGRTGEEKWHHRCKGRTVLRARPGP